MPTETYRSSHRLRQRRRDKTNSNKHQNRKRKSSHLRHRPNTWRRPVQVTRKQKNGAPNKSHLRRWLLTGHRQRRLRFVLGPRHVWFIRIWSFYRSRNAPVSFPQWFSSRFGRRETPAEMTNCSAISIWGVSGAPRGDSRNSTVF